MAAVARQIEVHAEEDGVVAVQTDTIVDRELGIVAEVEKVVAAVDVGDGEVAVMEQNRVKAIAAIPPQVPVDAQLIQPDTQPASSPQLNPAPPQPPASRSPHRPATRRPQQRKPHRVSDDRTRLIPKEKKPKTHHSCLGLPGCLFCGSLFLVAGAALVALAVSLVLPCGPLQHVSILIIIFGGLTIFVGLICCSFVFRIKGYMAVFCFFCVAVLLGLMLTAAAFESSFTFGDHSLTKNGTYIDGCKFDEAMAAPVALTVLSYVLFVLTLFLCLGTCINALTRHDPWLYKDRRGSFC